MIQGSNKLKNYKFRWLSNPLRLAKFESFWIQVYAIVAISGILGDISLLSLSVLTEFSQWFCCDFLLFSHKNSSLLPATFPPFYSVILKSRELLIPLFCSLGTRAHFVPITQKVESFPVSHIFLLLVLFHRKPMVAFPFRSALVPNVTFLMVQLLAILPLCHFSQVSGIQLC